MGIAGQRILTNLYQITEILHQVELQNKYTPTELLIWCQRSQNETNDEYEQRVESQDDAVQITTIHRCKGLTYKIVFAPYLDLKVKPFPIFEFREQGNYKYTYQPTDEQKILWREQNEQENRRLIYVALTRAQFRIYLCINNFGGFADSSIKNFPILNQKKWEANENDPLPDFKDKKPEPIQFSPKAKPEIDIKNTFGIHSFSALSKAHHSAPFEKAELGKPDNYDQFIFQNLGRGANVGTALHSIFERLDFNNPAIWDQTLADASKYYRNIIKEESMDLFMQMTKHIMNTEIICDGEKFALNKVTNNQKLPELEFCFSMSKVNRATINDILGDEADIGGDTDIEGLMTGFIDLLFERNGKYYILDWKSNHLGNSTGNYDRNGLEVAMKASNYNLQYMIYTVAVKRWLESRIKNFDYGKQFGGVIYVFLRGVRGGQKTGIYTTKPDLGKIESLEKLLKN
jgi:exodeoxyribonuclease V beta subunit